MREPVLWLFSPVVFVVLVALGIILFLLGAASALVCHLFSRRLWEFSMTIAECSGVCFFVALQLLFAYRDFFLGKR